MTPFCYVSPAPAKKKKKKKKKICGRNSVELDFGVNLGWDWHFVEQALKCPVWPFCKQGYHSEFGLTTNPVPLLQGRFLERREPPQTKVRFEKASLLKGTLSLHILFSTALHSGYSVSCQCPRLIFQLTYSSFLPHHFWNAASDIASVQRQPRCTDSLHRPNPSSRNLHFFFFSPSSLANHMRLLQSGARLWNKQWVCVCVCVSGCLWGSDKHMCAVVWLQNRTPTVLSW